MSCERAKDLMIDALVEPLTREHLEELRQHVADCRACAAEAAGYRELWRRLETVAIPDASPGGLERLQNAVLAEFAGEFGSAGRVIRPPSADRFALTRRIAAAVVLVGLGAALAIGLEGRLDRSGRGEATTDDRARYVLVMTETRESPELAAQAQSEVQAWFAGLAEQGIMESGVGLGDGPPVGTPPDGTLLNGPVAGFIVIRAASDQEARRIAFTSPVIDYGGFIEVRAVDDSGSDQ